MTPRWTVEPSLVNAVDRVFCGTPTPVFTTRDQLKKEIEQVATISANSDEIIGGQIAQAMDRVGQDGVITVEEAKGMENELDIVEYQFLPSQNLEMS